MEKQEDAQLVRKEKGGRPWSEVEQEIDETVTEWKEKGGRPWSEVEQEIDETVTEWKKKGEE